MGVFLSGKIPKRKMDEIALWNCALEKNVLAFSYGKKVFK